jgi:hypothetical protein
MIYSDAFFGEREKEIRILNREVELLKVDRKL